MSTNSWSGLIGSVSQTWRRIRGAPSGRGSICSTTGVGMEALKRASHPTRMRRFNGGMSCSLLVRLHFPSPSGGGKGGGSNKIDSPDHDLDLGRLARLGRHKNPVQRGRLVVVSSHGSRHMMILHHGGIGGVEPDPLTLRG